MGFKIAFTMHWPFSEDEKGLQLFFCRILEPVEKSLR